MGRKAGGIIKARRGVACGKVNVVYINARVPYYIYCAASAVKQETLANGRGREGEVYGAMGFDLRNV
jgi:hypothetical protein